MYIRTSKRIVLLLLAFIMLLGGCSQPETGVSSATICRVKKCLDYGSGGYRRAIDRAAAPAAQEN